MIFVVGFTIFYKKRLCDILKQTTTLFFYIFSTSSFTVILLLDAAFHKHLNKALLNNSRINLTNRCHRWDWNSGIAATSNSGCTRLESRSQNISDIRGFTWFSTIFPGKFRVSISVPQPLYFHISFDSLLTLILQYFTRYWQCERS